MARKRIGCYACFQTLDNRDKQPKLRTILKCEDCGALYHEVCGEGLEACYRCTGQNFRPVRIACPARLIGITKKRAQSIKPSTVLIVDGAGGRKREQREQEKKKRIGIVDSLVHVIQTLWATIFALFLVAIAAGIGAYFYRTLQLPFFSLQMVMDAILRTAPPPSAVVTGAIVSGLITGFVFYNRPRQRGRRFTYLLAGIVGLVAFNIWLLDISPSYFLFYIPEIINQYIELLYAQGIAAVVIVLLTPLHRVMVPIRLLSERSMPIWLNNLYGWLRLLASSVLVSISAVYFVTHWLSAEQQPKVSDFYETNLLSNLSGMSVVTAAAIASALTIAALLYWPPQFRQVKWRLGFIRLLMVVIGTLVIGFLYRAPINPELILLTLQYTSIMLLLGIPIQRALS
jgi:hypothetical protein